MAGRASTRVRASARAVTVAAVVITGLVVAGGRPADPQEASQEIVSPANGLVMDVRGASTAQGAPVIQWASNGQDNQAWLLKQFGTFAGSPLVLIQAVHSGRVLDAQNGSTIAGAGLVQNSWTGAPSQWWVVYRIGTSDFHLLMNVNSVKVADVPNGSFEEGIQLIQWPWQGNVNQIWETPAVIVPATTTTSTSTSTSSSTTSSTTSSTSTTTIPIEA